MDGTIRADIKPGILVNIILKKDQRSGTLTEGIVKDILTSAPKHHRGIKVRLEDGQIGRVQEIIEDDNEWFIENFRTNSYAIIDLIRRDSSEPCYKGFLIIF